MRFHHRALFPVPRQPAPAQTVFRPQMCQRDCDRAHIFLFLPPSLHFEALSSALTYICPHLSKCEWTQMAQCQAVYAGWLLCGALVFHRLREVMPEDRIDDPDAQRGQREAQQIPDRELSACQLIYVYAAIAADCRLQEQQSYHHLISQHGSVLGGDDQSTSVCASQFCRPYPYCLPSLHCGRKTLA